MSISSWTQGNHLCWRAASPRQRSWCHIGSGARVKIDTRSHRCAFIWGLRQRQWFKLLEDTWKVCTGGASVCEELREAHICEHLWLPAAVASWSPLIWLYFSSYFFKDPNELKLILIWISIEYGKVAKCILSWVSNKGSSAVSLTLPTAVDQILDISLLMHDFNATLTTKTNNQIAKCIWHQKFNRLCQGSNLYLWTVEPGTGGY